MGRFLVAHFSLCLWRAWHGWQLLEYWLRTEVIKSSMSTKIVFAELWVPQLLKFKLSFQLVSLYLELSDVLGELGVIKWPTQSLNDELSRLIIARNLGYLIFQALRMINCRSQRSRHIASLGLILHGHVLESRLHVGLDDLSFSLNFTHLSLYFLHALLDDFRVQEAFHLCGLSI